MKLHSETYDSYKNAEGEWSETIPSEWQEKRVKDLFRLVTDAAPADNDYELLSLYAGIGVKPRKDLEARGNKASTTDGYWIVRKNDIVVNKLLAWMGSVGLSEYDGVTSPAYDVLRQVKPDIDPRYFAYLFRTETAKKIFRKNSRGIMDMRLRLYFEKLGAITVPFPRYSTQQAVADYIEIKTTNIDKKIKLLKRKENKYIELRQSLITEIAFRGLDRDAPMKKSDIEWVGDIPTHWEVKRVKEIFEISRGRVIAKTELQDDGEYPVYSSQTKGDGCFGYIATFDYEGDYLTWTTDGVHAGSIFLRKGRFNCTNICGILKLKNKTFHIGYLYYVLHVCAKHNKRIDTNGAKIMSNEMMFIKIALPPSKEQKEIFIYLNSQTEKIDNLVSNIRKQIEILLQLRVAIINDAVTGKINVVDKEINEEQVA